ncbi:FAD-dependent oxidoreductase [Streptomyces sp. NPDC057702]|uniref:FAD-dependent oxidoreductase n=1 Tax=unclassified Streptomyces TaxID=2593676 RepID=UPI003680C490
MRDVAAHPAIDHWPHSTAWSIEPGRGTGGAASPHVVHVLTGPADGFRTPRTLHADALVLCPGAFDRSLPFPGWDLPGVVTAGAAQALAKGQRVAVGRRVVVSGAGPFLLPVAAALLGVGARVVAVLEAGSPVGWLRSPLAALRDGRGKLPELSSYAATLARHRVPYRTRRAVVAAHGEDRLRAVTTARLAPDWTVRPGSERRIDDVDALCVSYGFTPQLELALAVGCAVEDGPDGTPRVALRAGQATTVPRVYAAGELTGVGGAELAAHEGELAGVSAADALGLRGADPERVAWLRRRVRSGRRFAAALARAHPVRPGWRGWLTGDTLVCRCEEVSYDALRAAVAERHVDGVRALKLTSRAGLGACQGRTCGRAITELATALTPPPTESASALPPATRSRTTPRYADRYAIDARPIAQPIRLGDLANPPPEPSPQPANSPQQARVGSPGPGPGPGPGGQGESAGPPSVRVAAPGPGGQGEPVNPSPVRAAAPEPGDRGGLADSPPTRVAAPGPGGQVEPVNSSPVRAAAPEPGDRGGLADSPPTRVGAPGPGGQVEPVNPSPVRAAAPVPGDRGGLADSPPTRVAYLGPEGPVGPATSADTSPASDVTPGPEGSPQPADPRPAPEPGPAPDPAPDPAPGPAPGPALGPAPDPAPGPAPDPASDPTAP